MQDSVDDLSLPSRSHWEVQRSVTFALFLREVKARFGGRWLGSFWVLLQPTAQLTFMLIIWIAIRNRTMPGVDFAVFLITGIVPFYLFRNLALRLMEGVDSNRGLFGYRQVKPIDPMISRALLEVCISTIVYIVILMGLGWLGYDTLPARPVELIAMSGLLILMGFGLGVFLATATDELPQVRSFIRVSFLPFYILSGVLWPVHLMPDAVLDILIWNPVLQAIELSRSYFMVQYIAQSEVSVVYVSFWALTIVTLGLSLYRVRRHRLLAR